MPRASEPAPTSGSTPPDQTRTEVEEAASIRAERDLVADALDRRADSERELIELARALRSELAQVEADRARLRWDLERTRAAFARFRSRRAVRVVTLSADLLGPWLARGRSPAADQLTVPPAPPADPATSPRPDPFATGTVGADESVPDLTVAGGPGAFRRAFLDRLVRTPGLDGLRIATVPASPVADGGSRASIPAPWPDALVVDDPAFDIRQLPRHIVTVARVAGDPSPWLAATWFDQLDVVLVGDRTTADAVRSRSSKVAQVAPEALEAPGEGPAVRASLRTWAGRRRVAIMVQAPTWEAATTSGDWHFAHGLQRELERHGHPTSVYLLRQWPLPATAREDIVIHLWGRYRLETRPTQVNALWILYHPELVTLELLGRYDRVFAGSERLAAELSPQTAVPVEPLHQATDPERFAPDDGAPHHELLFVGNSRGARRTILHDLGRTTRDLAVYGGGWDPELLDSRYVRGASIPYDRLGAYYRAADIVLNDHWVEAGAAGLITNRIYDTLAAGGFAMSDPVPGLEEEFDGGVATYAGPADLAISIERYLGDPIARRSIAERGRRAVLERHTFAHRVDRLLEALLPLAEERVP